VHGSLIYNEQTHPLAGWVFYLFRKLFFVQELRLPVRMDLTKKPALLIFAEKAV
jgi:hypothetical protein